MSATGDLTAALSAWAVEVLPELQQAYDFEPDERTSNFPDLAVEIVSFRIATSVPAIGSDRLAKLQQIQQRKVRLYDLNLIVVVNPDPAEDADAFLKDFSDRLVDDLLARPTLGGRVNWVSDQPSVDFRPPLVEFDDGSRGRIVTLHMQVAQPLEEA